MLGSDYDQKRHEVWQSHADRLSVLGPAVLRQLLDKMRVQMCGRVTLTRNSASGLDVQENLLGAGWTAVEGQANGILRWMVGVLWMKSGLGNIPRKQYKHTLRSCLLDTC